MALAGLVHGIHAATVLLLRRPGAVTEALLIGPGGGQRLSELEAVLVGQQVPIAYVSRGELDALTDGARHQGVVLRVRPPSPMSEGHFRDLIVERGTNLCLLVLDGVQDPRNLGACLRTAAAAGVDAVLVPKDRAAGLTPAAVKVASGAAELVPLVRVTNLARALRRLATAGVRILGLVGGEEGSLYQTRLARPIALVLGGEEKGLRRLSRERCDQLVGIPMAEGVDSLNVAVAAGIALFELNRQQPVRPLVPGGSVG